MKSIVDLLIQRLSMNSVRVPQDHDQVLGSSSSKCKY